MLRAGNVLVPLLGFAALPAAGEAQNPAERGSQMIITSTVFTEGGNIPIQYTCDGADRSPPLAWSSVPQAAKTLALIHDDPDAPGKTWVHWVVINIPPGMSGFEEAIASDSLAQQGVVEGTTDFGRGGYGGPGPPSGTHRYYFKLYALDTALDLGPEATKKQVESAMEGHILEQAQLMGRYTRRR